MRTLHWGEREKVDYKQSAWYNHTFYRVTVSGDVDTSAIRTALHKRMRPGEANARLGKFGGWNSIGSVEDNGNGSVTVEVLYHIGD